MERRELIKVQAVEEGFRLRRVVLTDGGEEQDEDDTVRKFSKPECPVCKETFENTGERDEHIVEEHDL